MAQYEKNLKKEESSIGGIKETNIRHRKQIAKWH